MEQTVDTLDQTPRFAATDPFPHCLLMSHKKDGRFKWINAVFGDSIY